MELMKLVELHKSPFGTPTRMSDYYCDQCGELYVEEIEETEVWVACDMCNLWCHCKCEQLVNTPSSLYLS